MPAFLQSKLFPAYFQLNFSAIAAIFIVRGCPLRFVMHHDLAVYFSAMQLASNYLTLDYNYMRCHQIERITPEALVVEIRRHVVGHNGHYIEMSENNK